MIGIISMIIAIISIYYCCYIISIAIGRSLLPVNIMIAIISIVNAKISIYNRYYIISIAIGRSLLPVNIIFIYDDLKIILNHSSNSIESMPIQY